jgi:hypothetical protein
MPAAFELAELMEFDELDEGAGSGAFGSPPAKACVATMENAASSERSKMECLDIVSP